MSENSATKETVLEEGTEFDGSIRSKCPITVSGTLKGDVSAPSLTITASGSVYGQVKVSELRSQGVVAGQIDAESVELSGHVNDQTVIRASSLQVTLSQNGTGGKLQVTFGNCDLEIGKPTVPRDKSALREDGKQRRQGMDVNSGPAPEA